jgi:hypothetical protein
MPNEKKTNFLLALMIWDREIRGVRTDHNRDRESVERKIIAKRDIITRTDRVLSLAYEHQR